MLSKKIEGIGFNLCPRFLTQTRNNASQRRGSDLHSLVHRKGLEPPTLGTGIRCSIH